MDKTTEVDTFCVSVWVTYVFSLLVLSLSMMNVEQLNIYTEWTERHLVFIIFLFSGKTLLNVEPYLRILLQLQFSIVCFDLSYCCFTNICAHLCLWEKICLDCQDFVISVSLVTLRKRLNFRFKWDRFVREIVTRTNRYLHIILRVYRVWTQEGLGHNVRNTGRCRETTERQDRRFLALWERHCYTCKINKGS